MDEESRLPDIPGWVLRKELGRGGMGVVYEAVEPTTGRRRALKAVHIPMPAPSPDATALFEREIRMCGRLRHPHIVRMDDIGRTSSLSYFVMELCDGGSLMDRVAADGPMPVEEAVPLFLQVLDALTYAHTSGGTVHRDIKPQNILLTRGPDGGHVAKVADFGLAKAYQAAGTSGLTQTGAVAGTPAFMPRVQVVNYKYAKPPVDVWSAAASLYFVVTGHTPRDFTPGRNPWLTVTTALAVPARDRGVPLPEDLAALLDRALTDEPDRMFSTAGQLAGELRVLHARRSGSGHAR
ncbi:serine/threonine-protein kinase [Streptomyces tanashiensis]|uniref:serine/threonine-protein kinase n=1 Tax=Streptomyces tanashiensis TaxID=67367 RepID=UPI0033D89C78